MVTKSRSAQSLITLQVASAPVTEKKRKVIRTKIKPLVPAQKATATAKVPVFANEPLYQGIANQLALFQINLAAVQGLAADVTQELQSLKSVLAKIEDFAATATGNGARKADSRETSPGLEGAKLRGQAALAAMVADGTLVPSQDFVDKWGLTRQALEQAVGRSELFSLKIGNKRYYPSAVLNLSREDVSLVCKALGRAEPNEKLLFWLRKHGGMGGKTVAQAIAAGQVERAAQIADDWAEERGLTVGRMDGPPRGDQ